MKSKAALITNELLIFKDSENSKNAAIPIFSHATHTQGLRDTDCFLIRIGSRFLRTGDCSATLLSMICVSKQVFLFLCLLAAASSAWAATPCDGVDRTLTNESKATLASAIAGQLRYKRVDVLQSFRDGNWQILYVDTHESDNGFLFYSHDPRRSRYITIWGGVALDDEESAIRRWALKNAPGIPPRLAKCFAWHVTNGRDK